MSGCQKLSFASRGAANAYIRNRVKRASVGGQLRAYLCPVCGAFHLTSQSKAESRQIRRSRRRAA